MSPQQVDNELRAIDTQIEMLQRRLDQTIIAHTITAVFCLMMVIVFAQSVVAQAVFMAIAALSTCVCVSQVTDCAMETKCLRAYAQALDEWQGLFLAEVSHA